MAALARRIAVRLRRDERGAIGIIVAVLLGAGVLTGMGALVVDVGQLYQERAELQNSADAAALGVARSCVLGLCNALLAPLYADANASKLTGGVAGVSLVCGSGLGLGFCPGSTGKLTDCPPPIGANYVNVYTSTRTGSGSTLLPPVFGRTLLGSSYNGTNVLACAQATWGAPSSATTIALTISACEWDQATNLGTTFAPSAAVPSQSLSQLASSTRCSSSTRRPGPDARANHRAPTRQARSAGSRSQRGICTTGVNPPTITGRTRTTVSFSCQLLLQSAQNNETPMLVPIYVAPRDPAAFAVYTLKGFADFVVTGYNLDTGPFISQLLRLGLAQPLEHLPGHQLLHQRLLHAGRDPVHGHLQWRLPRRCRDRPDRMSRPDI